MSDYKLTYPELKGLAHFTALTTAVHAWWLMALIEDGFCGKFGLWAFVAILLSFDYYKRWTTMQKNNVID